MFSFQPADARLEETRQKLLPDLLADAQRRGSVIAAAAGVSLGAIKDLQDTTSTLGSFYNPTVSNFNDNGSTSFSSTIGGASSQQVTFGLRVTYNLQ